MSDTESLDGIFYNPIEYILEESKEKYFGAGLSKIVKKTKS